MRASPPRIDALAAGWMSALATAEAAVRDNADLLGEVETGTRIRDLHAERAEIAGLLGTLAHGQHGAMLLVDYLTRPSVDVRVLGLPAGVSACIFDAEGALTTSAAAHIDAWRVTLDPFLLARTQRHRPYVPFDPRTEYPTYLAGQPRLTGLRAFLAGRGISLPEGTAFDRPGVETVHGLANRKREVLRRYVEQHGIDAYAGVRAYLEVAEVVGARRAVVSASVTTPLMLERADIADLIEEQIDGRTIEAESLRPRPAPDLLLAACKRLGVAPAQAAAFETTPAGIAAARAAGVHTVVAVAREGETSALSATDADLVVADLGELLERAGRGELAGPA